MSVGHLDESGVLGHAVELYSVQLLHPACDQDERDGGGEGSEHPPPRRQ